MTDVKAMRELLAKATGGIPYDVPYLTGHQAREEAQRSFLNKASTLLDDYERTEAALKKRPCIQCLYYTYRETAP